MINIFNQIKVNDFLIGIKFENINQLKIDKNLLIYCNNNLFTEMEKLELKKILKKDIKFFEDELFDYLPFPVRNSKFNNFVLIYNGKNLILYQKNKPENLEKFEISENPLEDIKKISLKMLLFLKENYKYLQIVFIWDKLNIMKDFYYKWNKFREEKKLKKFIGDIFFSYFMEVGYEPSSPSS